MKLAMKWDGAASRAGAKESLDAVFMPYLNSLLTPKRSLYALKTIEADKVLAGIAGVGLVQTYSSPLLKPEATKRGMSEVDLAKAVKAKLTARNTAIATVEGMRQMAQAEIEAAANPAAIDAVLKKYGALLSKAYPAVIG
jgi:hypothetical protein